SSHAPPGLLISRFKCSCWAVRLSAMIFDVNLFLAKFTVSEDCVPSNFPVNRLLEIMEMFFVRCSPVSYQKRPFAMHVGLLFPPPTLSHPLHKEVKQKALPQQPKNRNHNQAHRKSLRVECFQSPLIAIAPAFARRLRSIPRSNRRFPARSMLKRQFPR